MTELQARAFQAQVRKEFPEQIRATIGRSQNRKDEHGWIVRLVLIAGQRTITAYKPDTWQAITWCWGMEDVEEEEKPIYHLIGIVPMVLEKRNGYWYGRYQDEGKTIRKYFGRIDPRPHYPIWQEDKVS